MLNMYYYITIVPGDGMLLAMLRLQNHVIFVGESPAEKPGCVYHASSYTHHKIIAL